MANATNGWLRRSLAALGALALLGAASVAQATHFRYGNLSWQPISGRTVVFQLEDAYRRSGPTQDPCVSPSNINTTIACTGPGGGHGVGDLIREDIGETKLQFGDGTCVPTSNTAAQCSGAGGTPLVYVVTSIDVGNNWSFVLAVDPASLPTIDTTLTHTYGGSATTFTARVNDCCRISPAVAPNGHINNPDEGYTLSTLVKFDGNSSPVSTQVPVVSCPYPAVCTFTVPASDPNGDTLRWRLASASEANAGNQGGTFVQPGPPDAPNALSVNPTTGLVTWNDTGATLAGSGLNTLYSTQIIIEDLDGSGNVKSRTPVDFLIQLVPIVKHPPACSAASPQTVAAGSTLGFTVSGTDPDAGDTLTLTAAGLPVGATMTPGLPATAVSPSAVSSNFSWTPTINQVGTYVVQYSVTDQDSQQALCPVTITVTCTAALCNDGNGCTDDTCGANGCVHTNNMDPCNDGNACTQSDVCSGGTCTGTNPVVCTAQDQCHVAGTCDTQTGVCSDPPKQNGSTCNDGSACTQTDTCQAGVCTGTNPVTCTASDQCHVAGVCNPGTGTCSNPNEQNGASCDDGNACTQSDTCQNGSCAGAQPVICSPLDQCHTAGTCNTQTGVCSDPPKQNGSACNDGNACSQTDTCQAGTCTGTNPVTCTALDDCHQVGACQPATGLCSNPTEPNGTACNNPGNLCNQTNTCQAGTCTGSNPITCAAIDQCHNAGTCNPQSGTCSTPPKQNGSACNDGNACTQTDTCQSGSCAGGNPKVCTALDQCHVAGTCDTQTGVCSNPNEQNGASCDDGNNCTQSDTCQGGSCTGAQPVICSPLDQCHTAGTCNTQTGVCSDPPKQNGSACNDGNACTQTDTCQSGSCTGGNPKVCTALDQCHVAGMCNTQTGVCSNPNEQNGASCEDGHPCTLNDQCQAGTCVGGPPPNCTDNNVCTDDACGSAGGSFVCNHTNNTASCTDGDACTLNDKCAGGDCVAGPPKDCNDNEICTDDACNKTTGNCTNTPNVSSCSDGDACTNPDMCNNGRCKAGDPLVCNDGNDCTDDTCSTSTGCVYTNNSKPCDDGKVCTDPDTCSGGQCQGTPIDCNDNNVCTTDSCNDDGGSFLCENQNCYNLPGHPCPPNHPECIPIFCGNGRVDPSVGETCDPPDQTIGPNGQPKCRPDCTSCGDGVVQGQNGETCDDGNLVSGCNPQFPQKPLDDCLNSCRNLICEDPAKIKLSTTPDQIKVHGRMIASTAVDFANEHFVIQITQAQTGDVVYRASLVKGSIHPWSPSTATYKNKDAKKTGGIYILKLKTYEGYYKFVLKAYGIADTAVSDMTTQVFVGRRQWVVRGLWQQLPTGWVLNKKGTFLEP